MICPARLDPVFSPRPWGTRSLAPFFPALTNLAEPIGEAWMTGNESVFATGPWAGQKLGKAWPQMPVEWTGTAVPRKGTFPILSKFIFTQEKLSVQVHPDDDYASKHEAAGGGVGKTEMWYAVRARAGAEVMAGLKPDVTPESFREAISDGTAEDCLERVCLNTDEAIFIPARTAHTIGPGLVLCEIQQHSDLTYRVFDYNRRDAQGRARELHVEKALDVLRFGPQTCGKLPPVALAYGGACERYLVACRYFATVRWEFDTTVPRSTTPEHFDLLIVMDGSGEILWGHERAAYGPAQAWLVPATLGDYRLKPTASTALLRTFVPADLKTCGKEFASRKIDPGQWDRLIRW